jgi:predicted DCC family thiol-disulfide oxidoreductase YuxK
MHKKAILYDADCGLCCRAANVVRSHDKKKKFNLVPIKSVDAERILKQLGMKVPGTDSVMLLDDDKIYEKSEAVFRIAGEMSGWYKLLSVFRWFPKKISDKVYDVIARNRRRWI